MDGVYENVKTILIGLEAKEAAKIEVSEAQERKNEIENSLVIGQKPNGNSTNKKSTRKLQTKNLDGSISGTVSSKDKKKTWEEKLMLHVLGSESSSSNEAPETAVLQKFMDFIKQKSYTLDNFLQDCFADIDDTPLGELIPEETRTLLKMVGLKTIVSRYCSVKRSFASELFMNEMQTMGVTAIFAAHFDSTLTAMRMAFTEPTPVIDDDENDDEDEEDDVNIVKNIFGD